MSVFFSFILFFMKVEGFFKLTKVWTSFKTQRDITENDSLQSNSDSRMISAVWSIRTVFISLLIFKHSQSNFNRKADNTLTAWLYYLPDYRESRSRYYNVFTNHPLKWSLWFELTFVNSKICVNSTNFFVLCII